MLLWLFLFFGENKHVFLTTSTRDLGPILQHCNAHGWPSMHKRKPRVKKEVLVLLSNASEAWQPPMKIWRAPTRLLQNSTTSGGSSLPTGYLQPIGLPAVKNPTTGSIYRVFYRCGLSCWRVPWVFKPRPHPTPNTSSHKYTGLETRGRPNVWADSGIYQHHLSKEYSSSQSYYCWG